MGENDMPHELPETSPAEPAPSTEPATPRTVDTWTPDDYLERGG